MNEPFDLYGTGDEKGFNPDPQDAANEASEPMNSAAPEEPTAEPVQEQAAPQYNAAPYGSPHRAATRRSRESRRSRALACA